MANRHTPYPIITDINSCPPHSAASAPVHGSRPPWSPVPANINSRKRPSGPGSRGASPPDKRVRSASYDQNSGDISFGLVTPPPSRNNSIASPSATIGESISNGGSWQYSGDASPLLWTTSPTAVHHDEVKLSSDEITLPVCDAPLAPPMVPTAVQHEDCHSGTIISVRATRDKKLAQAAQAAAQAHSRNNSRRDTASVIISPDDLSELKEEVAKLKACENNLTSSAIAPKDMQESNDDVMRPKRSDRTCSPSNATFKVVQELRDEVAKFKSSNETASPSTVSTKDYQDLKDEVAKLKASENNPTPSVIMKDIQELKDEIARLKASETNPNPPIISPKDIEALKDEITRLKSSNDGLQNKSDNAQQQQVTMRDELEELESQIKCIASHDYNTRDYLEELEGDLRRLEDDLRKGVWASDVMDDVEHGIGLIKAQRQETGKTLLERIQQLETASANASQQLTILEAFKTQGTAVQHTQAQIMTKLGVLERSATNFVTLSDNHGSCMRNITSNISPPQACSIEHQDHIDEIKKRTTTLEACSLSEAGKRMSALESSIVDLKKLVEEAVQRIQALEISMIGSDNSSHTTGEIVSALEFTPSNTTADRTLSRITLVENSNASIRKSLDDLYTQKLHVDNFPTEAGKRLSSLEGDRKATESSISELKEEQTSLSQIVARMEISLEQSQVANNDANERYKSEITDMLEQRTAMVAAFQDNTEKALAKAEHMRASDKEECMKKISSLESSQAALVRLKESFAEAERKYTADQNVRNKKFTALEMSSAAMRQTISDLSRKNLSPANRQDKSKSLEDRSGRVEVQVQQAIAKPTPASSMSHADTDPEDLRHSVHRLSGKVNDLDQGVLALKEAQQHENADIRSLHENHEALRLSIERVENNLQNAQNSARKDDSMLSKATSQSALCEKTQENVFECENATRNLKQKLEAIDGQIAEMQEGVTNARVAESLPVDAYERIQRLDQSAEDPSRQTATIQQVLAEHKQNNDEVTAQLTSLHNKVTEANAKSVEALAVSERSSDALEVLFTTLANLEARYENITTDTIYRQMVDWIIVNYPNAPDFLNQLREVQAQMAELGVRCVSEEHLRQRMAHAEESIKFLTAIPFHQVQEYCGSQPRLMGQIYQLQKAIEAINDKLPSGALPIRWNLDLSHSPSEEERPCDEPHPSEEERPDDLHPSEEERPDEPHPSVEESKAAFVSGSD